MLRIALVLLCAGVAGFCQRPDREPRPDEWGYRPAHGATVPLNPPALSWVAEKDAATYTVQWAGTPGFTNPSTVRNLPWSIYTHNATLEPGSWWWRYRIVSADGRESPWSRARKFTVPSGATPFPQPTMEELRRRIPKGHPRLFIREVQLPALRAWAAGGGMDPYRTLIARADELVHAEPTPEPTVRATPSDPATRKYWWTNRVQAIKALQEAEILSFAWLMTRDRKYAAPARQFTLKLAAWDPDGPSNFNLNCEVAKPLVHRLARAYDWAWPLFSEEERKKIRAVLLRRADDAWTSGEVGRGTGHLSRPYNSHGNRMWHKLAENAIATLDETPESEKFLQYAVTKFFGAYPVWSDDDGGWHEGLSYLGSYMSKAPWWIDVAQTAMQIDSFTKPFFARIGDYALYSAPPGTPDLGFGDSSVGPVSASWSFLHYYVRRTGNPHWAWWLDAWKVPEDNQEPVLEFLWSQRPAVQAKPPSELPPSKLFRGIGVAVMNSNLLDGTRNVQVRFKSSPMGRRSHGQDPHNTFTLNAYGTALLVNNVYRDLYGSPFQSRWVWSTRAQNAVLVDGHGQEPRSASQDGRIVKAEFSDGLDYVAGEAGAAYGGRLKRARRHIFFVKPDVVLIADDVEALRPSTFQWVLHAPKEFQLDPARQRLVLDRGEAGVLVEYAAPQHLSIRQWTGYDPEPDAEYLASVKRAPIPPQWHVEAGSADPTAKTFTITALRVFQRGRVPESDLRTERDASSLRVAAGDVEARFERDRVQLKRNGREWIVQLSE